MKNILNNLNEQQRREHYIKKFHNKLYNDIIIFKNKYFHNIELKFSQLLYHYSNNIKKLPRCKICGKSVNFDNFNIGYKTYCSKKCSMNDKFIVKKRNLKSKKTKLEKYNDENYNNIKKIKETNKKKYGVEYFTQTNQMKNKSKKTNKEKYGVEYFTQTKQWLNNIKKTNKEKYGVEYFTQTNQIKNKSQKTKLKKYGDKNYNNRKKSKETYNKKYGFDHHMKYKKNNNLLTKFNHNLSLIYYKKLLNDEYIIKNINKEKLQIFHKKCNKNFNIQKQLLYLRNKNNKCICTNCNPIIKNISYKEKDLLNFIKNNYNGKIIQNSKSIINPYELDIYLPDLNLSFEFNGLYWHNELHKNKNYHLDKTEKCLEKGIQLIHVWEDDWNYKQEIVKSMILNKLSKTPNKIYARKTIIKEITDNKLIKDFLNKNHIQGFVGSSIKIGLFYKNELVSLMTFGKKRLFMKSNSKEGEYELLRFCNKLNTNVIGGASKLFKYFLKNYFFTKIITYADRSHSQGELYEILGFNFISKTYPNYYYIIDGIRKHRFGFRKDVLIKEGFDPSLTEHEIMLSRKIYRIFDSGSLKYNMKIL